MPREAGTEEGEGEGEGEGGREDDSDLIHRKRDLVKNYGRRMFRKVMCKTECPNVCSFLSCVPLAKVIDSIRYALLSMPK